MFRRRSHLRIRLHPVINKLSFRKRRSRRGILVFLDSTTNVVQDHSEIPPCRSAPRRNDNIECLFRAFSVFYQRQCLVRFDLGHRTLRWLFLRGVVANVGASHPENYVFSNVGGVVGDALEVSRNQQGIECLRVMSGRSFIAFTQHDERFVFHAIHMLSIWSTAWAIPLCLR